MESKNIGFVREFLPFTVTVVRDAEALRSAVQVRHAAYARHLPDVARGMRGAETWDFADGTVVLVARSKLDGTPLGTVRLHSNEFQPLPVEQSFKLPSDFDGLRLVELTRFAIPPASNGSVLKIALLKAGLLCSKALGGQRMVLTARAPLDRMYERLLFTDVDPVAGFIPMAHVGGLPHRVLWQGVDETKENLHAANHPLYQFLFGTVHPDIDVHDSLDGLARQLQMSVPEDALV
jgi:hypothetical protein